MTTNLFSLHVSSDSYLNISLLSHLFFSKEGTHINMGLDHRFVFYSRIRFRYLFLTRKKATRKAYFPLGRTVKKLGLIS